MQTSHPFPFLKSSLESTITFKFHSEEGVEIMALHSFQHEILVIHLSNIIPSVYTTHSLVTSKPPWSSDGCHDITALWSSNPYLTLYRRCGYSEEKQKRCEMTGILRGRNKTIAQRLLGLLSKTVTKERKFL